MKNSKCLWLVMLALCRWVAQAHAVDNSPDKALPPAFASATQTLFQEGLADPRPGTYCQMSVRVGNVWSGGGDVMRVHGWALPDTGGVRQGVCWNGLTYSLVTVDGPADLAADVRALLHNNTRRFLGDAQPEAYTMLETSLLPLKACLLWRLGETGLAQQVWARCGQGASADPYLALASDWAWAMFDRAVTAHMRGDDASSLSDARVLTLIKPAIETEAARRGLPRPPSFDAGREIKNGPYLSFLEPLPALLADEQERAHAPQPPQTADLDKYLTKAARIAALIVNLNEVDVRQMSQPGGVGVAEDPRVQALVAQGGDAVEPLLDTFLHDTRLTRSASFGRSFFRERYLLSVRYAAYIALLDILHTQSFGTAFTEDDLSKNGDAGRQRVANALRAYWQQNGTLSLPERWYRTLADDHATAEQWLEAAGNVVQPSNVEIVIGSEWNTVTPVAAGHAPTLRGEALLSKTAPSVADLMARRVESLSAIAATVPENDSTHIFDVQNADEMALNLAVWDARAALPSLRAQFVRTQRMLAYSSEGVSVDVQMLLPARLTLARLRARDPLALPEYGAWLSHMNADAVPAFGKDELFEPFWRFPHDPACNAAARTAFLSSTSVWNPANLDHNLHPPDDHSRLPNHPSRILNGMEDILNSPALSIPAFREAVLRALADTHRMGVLSRTPEPDTARVAFDDEEENSGGVGVSFLNDPLAPPHGSGPVTMRVCDLYAYKLSDVEGLPPFQLFWPQAVRDHVITQQRTLLLRFGARYAFAPQWETVRNDFPRPQAHLSFTPLSRPATPGNVERGQAIFALSGTAHTLPLPALPLKARWTTLHTHPLPDWQDGASGKGHAAKHYDQDGWVWQAEQLGQNGPRFYGFVGKYDISRVPASDIEFPAVDSYNWWPLAHGVDCRVQVLGKYADGTSWPVLAPADPAVLRVMLRNRSGSAQLFSARDAEAHAAGQVAVRPGVTFTVSYSPVRVPNADNPNARPDPYNQEGRVWTKVTPAPTATLTDTAHQMLRPTEQLTAATFILRKLFDCTRPGFYRVSVTFAASDFAVGTCGPIVWEVRATQ